MKKILVISSDTNLLGQLKHELSFHGYTVLTEKNAGLTFKQINNFVPDMCVIDLILEDNNGGALSHQIKSNPHLHDLPVILLSDYELEANYPARFGCDRVIFKTGDKERLINAIRDLFEENEYVVN